MSVWVKFCGIRRTEDAEAAIDLGADAIGVIAVPSSPRCASTTEMKRLSAISRGGARLVLVVQDAERSEVMTHLNILRPDVIQFHGRESREFAESFQIPYIKATRDNTNLAHLLDHRSAFAHLVDSEVFASGIGDLPRLIIAGGLTCENAAERISMHKPWGVDVSRGIERSAGVKELILMREFLYVVRGAVR